MILCAYDDRKSAEPGIRLLVASLARHCSDLVLELFYSAADDSFRDWLAGYPHVRLNTTALPEGLGWNVKPLVLRTMLDQGHDDVVWIDTDIIIAADIRSALYTAEGKAFSADTVIMTEEALWGAHDDSGGRRTRAWGFPVGRALPYALNSGVVRVTMRHRALIDRWLELLNTPAYRAAQQSLFADRPVHMVGDQDVLNALLCSAEFADLPLHVLRRGQDILQLFGLKAFTLAERWQVLRHGPPPFLHSQHFKAWEARRTDIGALQNAYLDTSPYIAVARHYPEALGPNVQWLTPQSPLGRILVGAGFGSIPLCGLPVAAAVDVGYPIGRAIKRLRRAAPPTA